MSEWIPEYFHGSLADVGCGNVPMFGFYRSFVKEVTTIDWENSIHQNPHVDLFADLNQKPIPGVPEESFDCVLCTDVLEHLYEPRVLISEIARIMKPAGIALITVPFIFWLHEEPFDFYRYTPHSLKRMMKENGLKIQEFRPLGGAPEVLATLLAISALYCLGPLGKLLALWGTSLPTVLYKIPGVRRIVQQNAQAMCLGYALRVQKGL